MTMLSLPDSMLKVKTALADKCPAISERDLGHCMQLMRATRTSLDVVKLRWVIRNTWSDMIIMIMIFISHNMERIS